jgi:hypothetical protein
MPATQSIAASVLIDDSLSAAIAGERMKRLICAASFPHRVPP